MSELEGVEEDSVAIEVGVEVDRSSLGGRGALVHVLAAIR
jgi:hypothetical protein